MANFILFVVSLVIALLETTTAEGDSKSYTALRFAYDESSVISFSPEMNALTDKFSLCLWIKKLQSHGTNPIPFAYKNYEIFMADSGYYNRLFSSSSLDNVLTSKFTTARGSWYPYCSTWSLATRTFKVYVNGQIVGTQTTPSGRKLQTGGSFVLGNMRPSSGHRFGGEMFNFNVFAKELTAVEIATMAARGFCADIPEDLLKSRVIRWGEILKLARSGTVTDFIDPKCAEAAVLKVGELLSQLDEVESGATATQRNLQSTVSEKNSLELSQNLTQAELLKVQELFNSTQEDLAEVKRELNETKSALVDNQSELEDAQSELEDTQSELKNVTEYKCPINKGNVTKWDIFYSPTYYNKPFTRRLYQQLRTTWDSVSSKI